jgi:hypothetical protein
VGGVLVAGQTSYQPVKVCSLVSLAEVKKIAPWPPHLDAIAKATEEPVGTRGSSCNYPTADVQVLSFNQQTLELVKKSTAEALSGLGDEAYARNNRDRYAEVVAKVGVHLVTVQLNIGTGETFESSKKTAVALAQAFVAKLR